MALNSLGEEKLNQPKPVTLPQFDLPDIDLEREVAAAAERVAMQRTIRQGRDAWMTITKSESFENWKTIGTALAIGKAHALKVTQANAAWGRNYSREFSSWLKQYGFTGMRPSDRSIAIELVENLPSIEQWRNGLPERERHRLRSAQANVRRWRAATTHNGKCPQDIRRDARALWKRFVFCLEALPEVEAADLRKVAQDYICGT